MAKQIEICTTCGNKPHSGPCRPPCDGVPMDQRILNVLGSENATGSIVQRLIKMDERLEKFEGVWQIHKQARDRITKLEDLLGSAQETIDFLQVKCDEQDRTIERLRGN